VQIKTVPLTEPFTEAGGFAAVSHWLPPQRTPTIQGVWQAPGSIHVRVTDGDTPLHGVVEVGLLGDTTSMAASLDENGEALLSDVRTTLQPIAVFVDGFESPLTGLSSQTKELPADDALTNRRLILPIVVAMRQNHREELALHPESVGFVRGKVPGGTIATLKSTEIYTDELAAQSGAHVHLNPQTGEFVAGPFRAGLAHLTLHQYAFSEVHSSLDVPIRLGAIARADFPVPTSDPPPTSTGDSLLISARGATTLTQGHSPLHGTVFLPDGKTPAHGAQLLYYPANESQPRFAALTDANGIIHPRPLWISRSANENRNPLPNEPLIVALLPGLCGATLFAPAADKELVLILPQPLAIKGRITVAGASPAGKPGRIRVFASYEGKEKLNPILSVQTTADADGSFELPGLTPGTYEIQAALDDVWFSESACLDTSSPPSQPITLAIPAPSSQTILKIVNPDGSPRPGVLLHISRPHGPLEKPFSPHEWTADATGTIDVPSLETGPHAVMFENSTVSQSIDLTPEGPKEITLHAPQ
jgi:hypothetical protein